MLWQWFDRKLRFLDESSFFLGEHKWRHTAAGMTQAADRLRNVDGVDVEPNKMYFSTNIDAALLARTRLSGDAGELDRIVEHTKLRSARADFVHRHPDLLTKSS